MEMLLAVDIKSIEDIKDELKIAMINISYLEEDNKEIKEMISENIRKCINQIEGILANKRRL
ncbi:hypothetical protein NNC19_18050 [Clostridium sp. SHJSY1]|uniref:hypothetical protein n=1 Tax=Clostridium sp. SHJSY1 TaxID=2942483 RepID=UPI00287400A6|nr:hypothetical protein [Clostridium sp. SHJSY1]MDS0527596.1 hypothetical protein [Clostridium sp. SHJSY1]